MDERDENADHRDEIELSPASADVHRAITEVWNSAHDEEYRQDQSHYRGVGRWVDDEAWQNIGRRALTRSRFLWRLLGRPAASLSNLTVLEWGPGGGANAFGLKTISSRYYGVDISQKNLDEASRVMNNEGWDNYFCPVLLAGAPSSITSQIGEPVDLFLSTAVFQHFPSREYGAHVLEAIRDVCDPQAAGFIQIRFDNGDPKYRGLSSIDEYAKSHIYANSYRIDSFWHLLEKCGFEPLAVNAIRKKNNYATFFLKAR